MSSQRGHPLLQRDTKEELTSLLEIFQISKKINEHSDKKKKKQAYNMGKKHFRKEETHFPSKAHGSRFTLTWIPTNAN